MSLVKMFFTRSKNDPLDVKYFIGDCWFLKQQSVQNLGCLTNKIVISSYLSYEASQNCYLYMASQLSSIFLMSELIVTTVTNVSLTCSFSCLLQHFGLLLPTFLEHCTIHISFDILLLLLLLIKSVNETTHRYCAQVELQFRPKLPSSTHKSFKIPV